MTATEAARPALQYARDGFVVFRGLFSPAEIREAATNVDRVREQFRHLISVRNRRCRWSDNVHTGECQFDAFDPIIDLSPASRRLAYDRRLLDALAACTASRPASSRTS